MSQNQPEPDDDDVPEPPDPEGGQDRDPVLRPNEDKHPED